jgi:hypothetical protein
MTRPLQVQLVIAIMEIEAWFLGECTHFERIDPAITLPAASARLGFDPSYGNLENRPRPSQDLDEVYSLAGKSYTKDRSTVQITTNALDYNELRTNVSLRLPSLRRLVSYLEHFFRGGDWLTA